MLTEYSLTELISQLVSPKEFKLIDFILEPQLWVAMGI